MVLIHGWSQSGLQWYHQIEEFSETHRVIAKSSGVSTTTKGNE